MPSPVPAPCPSPAQGKPDRPYLVWVYGEPVPAKPSLVPAPCLSHAQSDPDRPSLEQVYGHRAPDSRPADTPSGEHNFGKGIVLNGRPGTSHCMGIKVIGSLKHLATGNSYSDLLVNFDLKGYFVCHKYVACATLYWIGSDGP